MANKFIDLPEKVREWLTSERVTFTIIELNKKLDLIGNSLSVIPNLVTRLVTNNLEPKNFIQELEDGLGLDSEQAVEISKEIVEKILKPIDLQLKETGVFANLIFGGTPVPPAPATPAVPTRPAPILPSTPTAPAPIPRPTPLPSTILQTPSAPTPRPAPIPPPLPPIVKIPINVAPSKPPLPPIPPKQ